MALAAAVLQIGADVLAGLAALALLSGMVLRVVEHGSGCWGRYPAIPAASLVLGSVLLAPAGGLICAAGSGLLRWASGGR